MKYWGSVPELFKWKNDEDLTPCPLFRNYQLVRNVLKIGVQPDGSVSLDMVNPVPPANPVVIINP
ncbi:MAG: hypothetical protein CVU41_06185 [Chloroflexi bacterium HGW-Chloroflexi-3]|nr:MAG: hypothetical protein CVU41_06185 [Chloroflexi bacterium HGW-Chloroflexi-3]